MPLPAPLSGSRLSEKREPFCWKRPPRSLLLACLSILCASGFPGFQRLHAREVVFAGYNVENYAPLLEPGRKKPGKTGRAAAVVGIVREISPDILGVVEMGPPRQFEEFRSRLTAAGLGYTDFEFVEAADPDRHLALASRFPIVARQSAPDLAFDADGSHEKMRRGILDVTVAVTAQSRLRIVGVHLKSKLEIREGEELLRRHEAHLLRQHIEAILKDAPDTPLLVFGDFNGTRDEAALREIIGVRGSPGTLVPVPLEDSLGDRWTHYWDLKDVYARIDYIFLTRTLSRAVDHSRSYIYRGPLWRDASDHRPLVVTLKSVSAAP